MNNLEELNKDMKNLLEAQAKLKEEIQKCDEEIEFGELAEDDQMVQEAQEKKNENEQDLKKVEEQIETLQKYIENLAKKEQHEAEIFNELEEKYPAQYDMYRITTMSDEEAQNAISSIPDQSIELKNSLEQEKNGLSQQLEATNARLEQIEVELNQIKEEFKQTHDMSLKDKLTTIMNEKKELLASKEQQETRFTEVSNQLESIVPQNMTVEEYKNNKKKELEGKYAFNGSRDYMKILLDNMKEQGYTKEEIVDRINHETRMSSQAFALTQIGDDPRYKEACTILKLLTTDYATVVVPRPGQGNILIEKINELLKEENISIELRETLTNLKATVENYLKLQREYTELPRTEKDEELNKEKNAAFAEALNAVCNLSTKALHTIDDIQKEKTGVSMLTDGQYSFEGLDRSTEEKKEEFQDMREKVAQTGASIMEKVERAQRLNTGDRKTYIENMAIVTDSQPGHYTLEDLEKYEVSLKFFDKEFQRAANDSNQVRKVIVEEQAKAAQPTLEDKDRKELAAMMADVQQVNPQQNTTGSVK